MLTKNLTRIYFLLISGILLISQSVFAAPLGTTVHDDGLLRITAASVGTGDTKGMPQNSRIGVLGFSDGSVKWFNDISRGGSLNTLGTVNNWVTLTASTEKLVTPMSIEHLAVNAKGDVAAVVRGYSQRFKRSVAVTFIYPYGGSSWKELSQGNPADYDKSDGTPNFATCKAQAIYLDTFNNETGYLFAKVCAGYVAEFLSASSLGVRWNIVASPPSDDQFTTVSRIEARFGGTYHPTLALSFTAGTASGNVYFLGLRSTDSRYYWKKFNNSSGKPIPPIPSKQPIISINYARSNPLQNESPSQLWVTDNLGKAYYGNTCASCNFSWSAEQTSGLQSNVIPWLAQKDVYYEIKQRIMNGLITRWYPNSGGWAVSYNMFKPGEDVSFFPMMGDNADPAKSEWIVITEHQVWMGRAYENSQFVTIYNVVQP